MRGVFDDDEEQEQRKPSRDTEFTLGAGTLLLLFFGLVVVCGLCFGLGYAVGHRGATAQIAGQPSTTGTPVISQVSGSPAKPSATPQAAAPPPVQSAPQPGGSSQPDATNLPQSTAAVAIPVGSPQSAAPAAPALSNGQLQVHAALPAPASAQQAAPVYPSRPAQAQVQHAPMPAAVPLWVQIAAVSHVEDAQVLTDALRKRGYTVTPRREPADNLIHVRIGPFSTRDEAERWRMKLLNDGYNAMVQP